MVTSFTRLLIYFVTGHLTRQQCGLLMKYSGYMLHKHLPPIIGWITAHVTSRGQWRHVISDVTLRGEWRHVAMGMTSRCGGNNVLHDRAICGIGKEGQL